MKDVELTDALAKKILLLDKHANYIEAFEKDKDDLVRYNVACLHPRPLPYTHAILIRSTATRST